jgi:vacuolar iron transporter family protein
VEGPGAKSFSRLAAADKELDAASAYRALAKRRQGEEREIPLAPAQAEERHAAHGAATLHPGQRTPHRPGLRARLLGWLARRVGPLIILGKLPCRSGSGRY